MDACGNPSNHSLSEVCASFKGSFVPHLTSNLVSFSATISLSWPNVTSSLPPPAHPSTPTHTLLLRRRGVHGKALEEGQSAGKQPWNHLLSFSTPAAYLPTIPVHGPPPSCPLLAWHPRPGEYLSPTFMAFHSQPWF